MDVFPSRPLSWNALRWPAPSRTNPQADPESQHWLVDGYNVLHVALLCGDKRDRIRWWSREGRNLLLDRILRFDGIAQNSISGQLPGDRHTCQSSVATSSTRISVVFDGRTVPPDPDHPHDYIEVIFAPSADDYLVSYVRKSDSVKNLVVVSSDRQVMGRCESAGATIVSPRNFVARCPEIG